MSAALERVRDWTTAQQLALVLGVWWIGNGLAVFLANPCALTSPSTSGEVDTPGVSIAVNGWHGLLHLATGLAGVAVCWRAGPARLFALLVGSLYLLAALWGLLISDSVLGLIRVDDFGSADHAVEGVLLLAGWVVSTRANRWAVLGSNQ